MKKETLILAVVLVAIYIVYRLTAYPSVSWVDSGAIATAAYTLGIANPPGFPLYMLIGNLFTKIPLGSVFFRLVNLSHLGAIITLIFVFLIVREILNESKNKFWAALASVLVLAFSYGFWSSAINVETFSLTNAFLFGGLYLTLKLSERKSVGWWVIVAPLLGIGAGLNPTISVIVAAGIWWTWQNREKVRQNLIMAVLALILALMGVVAIYSYLPIRAAVKPFLDWGDPITPARIKAHLVGAGLNIYEPETNSINGFTGQPKVWWESWWHYWGQAFWQFTPLFFPLIFWGAYRWHQLKRWWWPFFWVFGANILYIVLYYGGNQEAWMVTGFVLMAICIGIAFERLGEKWPKGLLVAVALIPVIFWLPLVNRSKYTFADDYATNLYREMPEGAVIIGGGDFFNSLTAYTHEVTKERADIVPVTANMFYIFPWYRENLSRHTGLVVSQKLEEIIQFKSAEEFTQTIDQLIEDNPEREFFVTPLILTDTVVAGHKEGNYHSTKYKLVPHGLVQKIVRLEENEKVKQSAFAFVFRYPDLMTTKTPFYLERNNKNAYKLLRNDYAQSWQYLAMYDKELGDLKAAENALLLAVKQSTDDTPQFLNRLAIFYDETGETQKAQKYFEKAVTLAPDNEGLRANYQYFLENSGLASGSGVARYAPTTGPNKHFEENNLSFNYPNTWKAFKDDRSIRVEDDGGQIVLNIRKTKLTEGLTPQIFATLQMIEGGEVVMKEGLAKIEAFDYAYVKYWMMKDKKQTLAFYLFRGSVVFEVLVTPADSPRLGEMDGVLVSLR